MTGVTGKAGAEQAEVTRVRIAHAVLPGLERRTFVTMSVG